MTTVSRDLEVPARALAVGAHPDDIEFGCGGTLAKWAGSGCEIHHLVCTDGSKGSWDPSADTAQLIVTRQEEQRAAARELGGKTDVVFSIDGKPALEKQFLWAGTVGGQGPHVEFAFPQKWDASQKHEFTFEMTPRTPERPCKNALSRVASTARITSAGK